MSELEQRVADAVEQELEHDFAAWLVDCPERIAQAALKAHAEYLEEQGLVVVPREPTSLMCEEPLKQMPEHENWLNGRASFFVWQAMISAAQQQEE